MLQFILAVTLYAQIPEPPTDRQVLATLPATDAVRAEVSISKHPPSPGDTVWTCITYYTEIRNGVGTRRLHVSYLERKVTRDAPGVPERAPYHLIADGDTLKGTATSERDGKEQKREFEAKREKVKH